MRVHVSRQRWALGVGFLVLGSLAVLWGRTGSLSQATAQGPQTSKVQETLSQSAAPTTASDYSHRVVAYIFNTIPVTREELGEYLIARMGAERLSNMVNKRIIEYACRQKGIDVTAAEVEADLAETLQKLGPGFTVKDFETKLLKPHNKTLYEWKEDVIKPRLLLTKLCRDRIQVTDEDLQNAFEAYYGEKVECQMIMWPKSEERIATTLYPKIRDSEEEFDRAAKQQANPQLAAAAGRIDPFGRHTTGNEQLEKAAFALKPGELSQVIGTPEGSVVLKCIRHLPPDKSKKLEEVRAQLTKDIVDRKINQQEIPKIFAELRDQAQPKLILKEATTEEELLRDVREELKSDTAKSGTSASPVPNGN